MAEVYEVGRKAFEWLVETGRLHDECRGHGDYVVVSCLANPRLSLDRNFCAIEYFESEYWAARRADGCESVSLDNQRYLDCWYPLHAYEVWHVVDDDETVYDIWALNAGKAVKGNRIGTYDDYGYACKVLGLMAEMLEPGRSYYYLLHERPVGHGDCCDKWLCTVWRNVEGAIVYQTSEGRRTVTVGR